MSPPTKTFKCGSCNDNINKNQTSIQCKECALWFHITCAKIPEKVLSALKDSRLSFTCTSCNNDPRSGFETMLRNEISSLNCKIDDFINKVDSEQTSIKNALADTVASLKSEIASCLKEMKSEIVDCNKLINNVEISTSNKITALEEENNCLHRRLNRTNIIVTGLPAGIDDLMPVIMKLGTIFDVPICTYDLQYICYMNNRKSILVRDFVDGDVDLRVYLNDHYSPAASRLNMICKKLLRKDLIKKFRIMNSDRLRVKLTLPDDSEVVYSPSQCADLLDDGHILFFYNDAL
ncbi:uncharacterized protein LOC111687671 isoform X2 [Lucilia cuprina]|uniref:uncharacterized protein LOC111687671 isoform X2 n=2 Tax=Lucilia cuprina TaxID=7375 RepID=UPI001F05AD76|nr:uncharacterized protein LOC111687671 isoform X2 [Lucilia cuprina]